MQPRDERIGAGRMMHNALRDDGVVVPVGQGQRARIRDFVRRRSRQVIPMRFGAVPRGRTRDPETGVLIQLAGAGLVGRVSGWPCRR